MSRITLSAVQLARLSLYRGVGRFFPAELERFRAHVPEASDQLFDDGGLLDAYTRRCSSPGPAAQASAAAHRCAREDTVIAHETLGVQARQRPPRPRPARAGAHLRPGPCTG